MLDIRLFLLRFTLILCAGFWSVADAQERLSPQQLFKDGDTAYTRGDYETARQSFEKAWQAAQSLPADSSPAAMTVLKRRTAAHAASGLIRRSRPGSLARHRMARIDVRPQ